MCSFRQSNKKRISERQLERDFLERVARHDPETSENFTKEETDAQLKLLWAKIQQEEQRMAADPAYARERLKESNRVMAYTILHDKDTAKNALSHSLKALSEKLKDQ